MHSEQYQRLGAAMAEGISITHYCLKAQYNQKFSLSKKKIIEKISNERCVYESRDEESLS